MLVVFYLSMIAWTMSTADAQTGYSKMLAEPTVHGTRLLKNKNSDTKTLSLSYAAFTGTCNSTNPLSIQLSAGAGSGTVGIMDGDAMLTMAVIGVGNATMMQGVDNKRNKFFGAILYVTEVRCVVPN